MKDQGDGSTTPKGLRALPERRSDREEREVEELRAKDEFHVMKECVALMGKLDKAARERVLIYLMARYPRSLAGHNLGNAVHYDPSGD